MSSKNRVIYSELKVSFKSGKNFTFKRVLKYEYQDQDFVIHTKNFFGTYEKRLEAHKISRIEEHLKREIRPKL